MTAEDGLGNRVYVGKPLEGARHAHEQLCARCGRCTNPQRDWVPAIVVAVFLLAVLIFCGAGLTIQLHALKDRVDRCERDAAHHRHQRNETRVLPKSSGDPQKPLQPPWTAAEKTAHREMFMDEILVRNSVERGKSKKYSESTDDRQGDIYDTLAFSQSRKASRLKRSGRLRDRRQGTSGSASTQPPTRHRNKCPRRCRRCCTKGEKGEKGDPGPPGQMAQAAALYQGDVDKFDPKHFAGERDGCDHANKLERTLRSCDGRIQHWEDAPWMKNPALARYHNRTFSKRYDGAVLVLEAGFYYLFGQTIFYNNAPFNTAGIDVNGRSVVRCTNSVSRSMSGSTPVYQTCSMNIVWYLERNDEVRMAVKQQNRVIDMRPDTTFFGVVKLTDDTHVMSS